MEEGERKGPDERRSGGMKVKVQRCVEAGLE